VPPVDPEVLQRRPDVTAAEARLAAAASARDLARAGRVPDVTVGAQYEHYPVSEANTTGSGNSYGVFVSIPLFVRHSLAVKRAAPRWTTTPRSTTATASCWKPRTTSAGCAASSNWRARRCSRCDRRAAGGRKRRAAAPSSPIRRAPPACWTCSTRAARCARRAGRRRGAGHFAKALSAYLTALQTTNSDINKLPQVRTDASRP
jgi:cobalt-zinc-cadmium efflux system outer membrane protein